VLSVECFLATAYQDQLLKLANERVDFLQSTSSNTPYFDRVEFRTQTDDFELSKQRYSVRLYTNGLGETEAGRKVYETSLRRSKIQREFQLHQGLKKRYFLVIDLLHSLKILELNRKAKAVYKDMEIVLDKSRNCLDFDIKDLIDASDDHTETQLEVIEIESRVKNIEDAIRWCVSAEGPVTFSTENMADTDLIRDITKQLGDTLAPDNAAVNDSNLRVELARNWHELEEAQSRKHIRFLELSYDNEERHDASKAYFLELGVTLPFVVSNRLDVNRRKLQLLTEESREKELKRTLEERLATSSGDIKRLLAQYAVLSEVKQQAGTETLLKLYMQIEGVSPLVLLEMKESVLKRDIALERIRYEIFTNYIDLLDITGKLSEKPLRNYISADLERITPCEGDVRK